MAKTDTIEILVDEVTLHQETLPLTNSDGQVVGAQLGLGKTRFKGERVPVAEVAQVYLDALDDEDHPSHASAVKRYKRSTKDPQEDAMLRLGLPFPGYEDLEDDQIVALLPNLPSETVQRIKEWEGKQDEPRERIVTYSVGFGESPLDRQEGNVNSGTAEDDEDPDKPVRQMRTRSVPEDGPVESGEGITGTGEPASQPGSAQDEESGSKAAPKRRSRRTRSGGTKTKTKSTKKKVAARKPSQSSDDDSDDNQGGESEGSGNDDDSSNE